MLKMVNFTLCVHYQIFLKIVSKILRIEEDQETPAAVLLTPQRIRSSPTLPAVWCPLPDPHTHQGILAPDQWVKWAPYCPCAPWYRAGASDCPGWAETTRGNFRWVLGYTGNEAVFWDRLGVRTDVWVDCVLATVFVSCCCYKQWPGGFKQHTFILSSLQVGSLTWVPLSWNQGVGRAIFLPGGSWGGSASLLFPASRGSPHSIIRARSPASL